MTIKNTLRRTALALTCLSVCTLVLPAAALAQGPNCTAPASLLRLSQPLARISNRIAAGQPITIVALGSSSTAGAGATSSTASYPSRLEAELKQRFPRLDIRVLNRGVSGEESSDMVARFERSVFAEQPDLIIWQMGTNTILREKSIDAAASVIHDGVARLRASGADVILMDPQFAPKVIVKPAVEDMVTFIAGEAKSSNTDLFQRFAVMNYWHEVEQIPFEAFISPDGYHMNDWSYGCLAKLLGGAIAEAATRSVNVARVPTAASAKP